MGRKTYFQEKWLTDPLFQQWLKRVLDRETAIFAVCFNKKIPIGCQDVAALRRHAGYPPYEHLGKKHEEQLPVGAGTGIACMLLIYSSSSTDQSTASSSTSSASSLLSSSSSSSAANFAITSTSSEAGKKQGVVTDLLLRENVLDAEIRLCLKITKSKYSQRSVDDM